MRNLTRLWLGALLLLAPPAWGADLVFGTGKRNVVTHGYAALDKLISLEVCTGDPLVCNVEQLPDEIQAFAQRVVDDLANTDLGQNPSGAVMTARAATVVAGGQRAFRATTNQNWARCGDFAQCDAAADVVAGAVGLVKTAVWWNWKDTDACGMRFQDAWLELDCSPEAP